MSRSPASSATASDSAGGLHRDEQLLHRAWDESAAVHALTLALPSEELLAQELDLVALEESETTAMAMEQVGAATGMTDYEAVFMSLVDLVSPETDRAIDAFYRRWREDPVVSDKWFRMQAISSTPAAFDRVVALSQHPDFNLANPNRARSLLYAFAAGNPVGFHRADGAAYRFVANQILELDARIVSGLSGSCSVDCSVAIQ